MVDGLDETAAEEDAGRSPLAPGKQLGKYRLSRMLGAGGMGVVWVAHDPDLDREIAIKLLRNENAPDALRTRLLREARAMARLKHGTRCSPRAAGSPPRTPPASSIATSSRTTCCAAATAA